MRLALIILLALALGACTSTNCIREGEGGADVMVMVEDAGSGSFERSSAAARQLQAAVQDQLNAAGFRVYDEAAVTFGDYAQDRNRRGRAELLEIARSVTPSIDALALVSLYTQSGNKHYTQTIRLRASGELIQPQSGNELGSEDVKGPSQAVRTDCRGDCLTRAISSTTASTGADLGAALADKLTAHQRQCRGDNVSLAADYDQTYEVVLAGFTPIEADVLESRLEDLQGYEGHRLVYSGRRHRELSYSSSLAVARLNRSIHLMLRALDLRARVQLAGNAFRIDRITAPRRAAAMESNYDW